ncbi:MAG: DUF3048 domain-containing protein [bacterium]|nr:DUF3048 domain-containing protein [bacterium]
MRKIFAIALLTILTVSFAGCSNKDDEKDKVLTKVTETPVATVAPTEAPDTTHDGMERSKLTNEWIAADKANARPYAIMLSNIKAASPQSGISQASILYECLVEGGITRMMGIFEDFDADRIGSVRSARHYYVSLADEYDAIICHYGQSKYTEAKLEELGVDNLSGLASIGTTVFYRDNNIKSPHNAFASYDGIVKGAEKLEYRTEYRDNLNPHYKFYDEDTAPESSINAEKVNIQFSKSYAPEFTYDAKTKLYARSQFGEPHVDASTGEQLTFKNLLIQFVKESTMDSVGRQDMELSDASGTGYYVSDGKAVKITWKKNEKDKTMSYCDESGEQLTVNTGKTYIALFPDDKTDQVSFE